MSDVERLRYPIGQFQFNATGSVIERRHLAEEYDKSPDRLDEAVAGLSDEQLDTSYRPGGWTIRQVVHHLPESHMNAYVRLKFALTEKLHRSIVADEAAWANLQDSREGPIAISLALFRVLQQRWAMALRCMSDEDFSPKMWHPAWETVSLDYLAQVYAWHARHHTAHITALRERMGWWPNRKDGITRA